MCLTAVMSLIPGDALAARAGLVRRYTSNAASDYRFIPSDCTVRRWEDLEKALLKHDSIGHPTEQRYTSLLDFASSPELGKPGQPDSQCRAKARALGPKSEFPDGK